MIEKNSISLSDDLILAQFKGDLIHSVSIPKKLLKAKTLSI